MGWNKPFDAVVGFVLAASHRDGRSPLELAPIADDIIVPKVESTRNFRRRGAAQDPKLGFQPHDGVFDVVRLEQREAKVLPENQGDFGVTLRLAGLEECGESVFGLDLWVERLGEVEAAKMKSKPFSDSHLEYSKRFCQFGNFFLVKEVFISFLQVT